MEGSKTAHAVSEDDTPVKKSQDIEAKIEALAQKEAEITNSIAQFEADGRYIDAQEMMTRLKEIRIQMGRERHKQVMLSYEFDKMCLEEQKKESLDNLRREWDAKLEDYTAQARQILEATKERHKVEYDHHSSLWTEKLLNKTTRYSGRLLSMKKSLEILVREKDYVQAQSLKKKINIMKKEEEERYEEDMRQRYEKKMVALVAKQRNELKALKQRLDVGRDDLVRQRKAEIDRLVQFHRNHLRELDLQRRLDRSRGRLYLSKQEDVIATTPKRATLSLDHIRRSPESPSIRTALMSSSSSQMSSSLRSPSQGRVSRSSPSASPSASPPPHPSHSSHPSSSPSSPPPPPPPPMEEEEEREEVPSHHSGSKKPSSQPTTPPPPPPPPSAGHGEEGTDVTHQQ
eukprot:TRINITY_DN1123_c0_g1_i1.p1 TRINITY_DN1123_c0_g1~~TRINITY_DN1123_c0_g1_i1.p1  ORF type:complete len:401 (-),score=149.79 TRINITY_DN1123_c0_g1_i1:417-1619(-)